MTQPTYGYAAVAAAQPLAPRTWNRREVGTHDVRIAIAYAGICHSDIHTVRGEWGAVEYPLTPGHEITGTITEVGAEATTWQVGDVVGVGCFVNSCRTCEACLDGEEQYCPEVVWTYGALDRDGTITQGGYATDIVVDADYVVRMPEGLDLAAATPLLCAGITTFSPLRHWQAGPDTKVAVIGMGGLGHVAVKIAVAMGCEVTVLSHSEAKQTDAKAFGAQAFFSTQATDALPSLARSFDLILNTVSAKIDLDAYLNTLRRNGTLVELGLPEHTLELSAFSVVHGRRSLAGSGIGGIRETQEMLDFCAEHGITAEIELISADQINDAYERVLASDVRYRFVIDISSIKP